ncbi:trafficking protein particle complex subunit 10 [Podospora conica]|nr:trafficking protein particle complex subunit 10 [Schizothecium conicum]
MEQPSSSSKVTVEYFDPHDVYKLLAPGLIPRLPLRNVNWVSHNGPIRSIPTLHIELVSADSPKPPDVTAPSPKPKPAEVASSRDDGFQTAPTAGRSGSVDHTPSTATSGPIPGMVGKERRHQIPGLRRTPYLKVLFVRCDDNETYKSTTKAEIREWIKKNTAVPQSKTAGHSEKHDAFEWLIVHVVIPNTVAATQPRTSAPKVSEGTSGSRWRGGSTPLLEKLRADFNGSSKDPVERVCQIRIGINDVPYEMFPRVVPAVPSGYHETAQDSEEAWANLVGRFKELILLGFDTRVSQYEDDIRERDGQRALPGWNFCTFFILKEGLARGFESVGLVEDALVGYDELSVGLDAIIQEQAAGGSAEAHGGALLPFTDGLKSLAQKALEEATNGQMDFEEEPVDLQSEDKGLVDSFHTIPISSSKKPYRELILANNVSLFDFRCYIFARQISLLLRLGNAISTREELLAKLKEQQELVPRGVAPRTPMPKQTDESENLLHLAEICRRALEFVPSISTVARKDIITALTSSKLSGDSAAETELATDAAIPEIADNVVASFAFSVAQQILAQTSTKALPFTLGGSDGPEPKSSIPEPKTMMHPARNSSLLSHQAAQAQRPPPSPGIFPPSRPEETAPNSSFPKAGLEELAARRAELYSLSRNILEECGKKRGWTGGWSSVPVVGEPDMAQMEEVSLDDDESPAKEAVPEGVPDAGHSVKALMAGLSNKLLHTALSNRDDFYRLFEILTDKALVHYRVAEHEHSTMANMADLAVLKFHLGEFSEASDYFDRTIPFFGVTGWSLLELSMLLMYAKCLKELRQLDDYVNKALRLLLTKGAVAERDRVRQKSLFRLGQRSGTEYPDKSALAGYFTDLLTVASTLEKPVRIPLINFFSDVDPQGPPVYDEGQDSFSLHLRLHSLLVDSFEASDFSVRIAQPAPGGTKEIWLKAKSPVTIKPGRNVVRLQSTTLIVGNYEVDQIRIASGNVFLNHDRQHAQPYAEGLGVLKNPRVTLYQRASCLDARLLPTREVRLDMNNSLDLEITSGWNDIKTCEVRIRSATGGLRLLMAEATVPGSIQPTKRTEGGVFTFGAIPANTSVRIRFPFSLDNELVEVTVKSEVSYTTDHGDHLFSNTSSVPITLALGVNVQDVFKHKALFSRFSVSTASASPLRLFRSELLGSDMFESHFGRPPSHPIMVFPKQPASLLYKIKRKPGSKVNPKKKSTLRLKIHYSVLQDEIEALVSQSLQTGLDAAGLHEYSKLVISRVVSHLPAGLSPYDLEKAALLGEFSTAFLSTTPWEKQFPGLGPLTASEPAGTSPAARIADFITSWIKQHPKHPLPPPDPANIQPTTIVIPVDVPPVTIVHTADIQFQRPLHPAADGGNGYAFTNELLPATLHLKWTRIWDTSVADADDDDDDGIEFGYEITAPSDTWLLGGRRKGHFVIPGRGSGAGLTSTPGTEADIPLLLVPLREGWLPFPNVEIREVRNGHGENGDGAGAGSGLHRHCETDYRNLGEAVHVVPDRAKVTLSLDASGPGGGPLVLESERGVDGGGGEGGRVIV